jgi:hypothetical protein
MYFLHVHDQVHVVSDVHGPVHVHQLCKVHVHNHEQLFFYSFWERPVINNMLIVPFYVVSAMSRKVIITFFLGGGAGTRSEFIVTFLERPVMCNQLILMWDH